MANYRQYVNALRKCAKEHEYKIVPFAHIRTADLCKDTAELLEKLETGDTIIIPSDATNGDIFKMSFPMARWWVTEDNEVYTNMPFGKRIYFSLNWWNAPYKKEMEE